MATNMSVALKNALLTTMLTSGSNAVTLLGSIDIYTGSPPATPETTASGTLLGTTVVLAASHMRQSSLGTAVLSAALSFTPVATGTAGWARWKNANNGATIDMDATVPAGGGGIILPSLSLTSGAAASVSAASIQIPSSLSTVMLNTTLRNKLVNILFQGAENIGIGQSGSILLYSGSAPASADVAATGTLLATIPTGTTAWNTPSGGSAALVATLTATAAATGTVGYARLTKAGYTIQGSVGVGSGDFALDTVSAVSGVSISCTNLTLSF